MSLQSCSDQCNPYHLVFLALGIAPWIYFWFTVIREDFSAKNENEESSATIKNDHREPGQKATPENSQYSDTGKPDDYDYSRSGRC